MKIKHFQKEKLNFIEISNELDLKVVFCDLGASVFNIYFHDEPMTRNVKNVKDYYNPSCFYGKTVGRTSNRLKGHRYIIDGQMYNLENNEGHNVLHGGRSGLSNQRFAYLINNNSEFTEIVFTYHSPDLESGYPGNVDVTITYKVYVKENVLEVVYKAKSDANTLFSLTNHAYFTLGDEDISNLDLYISSHKYLDVNRANLLPLEIKTVDEVMDFSHSKKIMRDIDSELLKGKMMNGYDSYFYFDDNDPDKVNVTLSNDRYRLDIYSNFEGTQIYTSNYEPEFELNNKTNYRDSIAIEPSDSFLEPPVLLKNSLYSRFIRYKFISN